MDEGQIHRVGQTFQELIVSVSSRIAQLTDNVNSSAATQHSDIENELITQDVDKTIESLNEIIHQARDMDTEMDKLMQLAQIVDDYGARMDEIEQRLRTLLK